jgi:hypothetical protein
MRSYRRRCSLAAVLRGGRFETSDREAGSSTTAPSFSPKPSARTGAGTMVAWVQIASAGVSQVRSDSPPIQHDVPRYQRLGGSRGQVVPRSQTTHTVVFKPLSSGSTARWTRNRSDYWPWNSRSISIERQKTVDWYVCQTTAWDVVGLWSLLLSSMRSSTYTKRRASSSSQSRRTRDTSCQ